MFELKDDKILEKCRKCDHEGYKLEYLPDCCVECDCKDGFSELKEPHKPSSYEAFDYERDKDKQGIIIDDCLEYYLYHEVKRLLEAVTRVSHPRSMHDRQVLKSKKDQNKARLEELYKEYYASTSD